MASFQPLPFAKRQKISSAAPTLVPAAPREPRFHPTLPVDAHDVLSSRPSASSSAPPSSSARGRSGRVRNENPHGNFSNYYKKRRGDVQSGPDPRLELVPAEWFKGSRVLDVGCNAGAVTVEIAQRYDPLRVTGVDIDPSLIGQCHQSLKLSWSQQRPLKQILDYGASDSSTENAASAANADPSPSTDPVESTYFPLALPRMYGFLPFPPKHSITRYKAVAETMTSGVLRKGTRKVMPKQIVAFPGNIEFEVADWVNDSIKSDKAGYDVIVALSVTKWIHLHGLNEGLLRFFSKCFSVLRPEGKLILEPQAFSTYAKSARKAGNTRILERLKANLEKLRNGEGEDKGWRYEDGDFERVLLGKVGFERVEKLGETGTQGFRRPLEVYHKKGGSWI